MKNISYPCQILLELAFFDRFSKKMQKYSKTKFSENPSNGSHGVESFLKIKIRPILPIHYSLSLKAKCPPFNHHSIRLSPDPKSHSYVHNSATAPYSETNESLSNPPSI